MEVNGVGMSELVYELNRLAGTTGLSAQGAANVLAGTTQVDLVGALNTLAGTSNIELNGVLKRIAGLYGGDSSLDGNASLVGLSLTTPFITAVMPGTPRNDASLIVGCKFTVGATPLTVRALGRWVLAGNTGTHLMKLADASGTDIVGASTTVVTAGVAAETFSYANLSSPVVLSASTAYFIGSTELLAGDQWLDENSVLTTTAAATINRSAYSGGGPWAENPVGVKSYGPVNFKY